MRAGKCVGVAGVGRLLLGVLAATVSGWGGCGDDTIVHPPPTDAGTLTLVYEPTPPQVSGLSLDQMRFKMEGIAVIGDVAPDARTMVGYEVEIDMLGAPESYGFPLAPPGLYSRVRCNVDEIRFQGTYNGLPLQAQIEADGMVVDLRDAAGRELGADSVTFEVTMDGSQWFANGVLDSAVVSGGQIVIDQNNNLAVGHTLAQQAVSSFALKPAQPPTR